jgi:hypothetical protein
MTEPDAISLREYLEKWIDERWVAHGDVHRMLDEAVSIALKGLERRLDEMNQFRAQIQQERESFVSKPEYDARNREVSTKIDAETKAMAARITVIEMAKSNLEGRVWMLGATLTGVTILLNLLFRYWPK